ncbi:hypothetical protein AB0G74_30075 [Streptomyces sp. NPDC020875]|uniref:hypothetical protein n=1 Tax=Streptomyces sp. NPDC020875 TaxID=3154898 RepID=UPI0033CB631A
MSLLHHDHPWLGLDVEDTAIGRRGTLRAIAPDSDQRSRVVAWLHPPGGGTEWTTDPDSLTDLAPVTPGTRPAT